MTTSISHSSTDLMTCQTLHNMRRFLHVMGNAPDRTASKYLGKTQEIIILVNALLFDQRNNAFRAFRKIVNPEAYITQHGVKQNCRVIHAWASLVPDGWIKRIDVLKWIREHREDEILIKIDYDGDANLLRPMDEFLLEHGIQTGVLKGGWDTFVTEPGDATFKLLSLILVNYALPLEEEFKEISSRHIINIKESLSPKIAALFETLENLDQESVTLSRNIQIIKQNWHLAQHPFQQ